MENRPMDPGDWSEVRAIYEQGLSTGQASFQTSAPSWQEWDLAHLAEPRLVVLADGRLAAWAALSPVASRCVYAGVAEVSIYVLAESRGKGLGKIQLDELIRETEILGIWTLQAGILPENEASL